MEHKILVRGLQIFERVRTLGVFAVTTIGTKIDRMAYPTIVLGRKGSC